MREFSLGEGEASLEVLPQHCTISMTLDRRQDLSGEKLASALLNRGKEMSLSRFLGVYYKLPKSDPNAVYLLPNAVYLLQCCFIAANIVWAGQCDNSLFPWKLYKINLTAQQTINTTITN